MISAIEDAVVVKQDPDNYAVFVQLLGKYGGQGPMMSVQVATAGPRDAVRGNYPELPTPGTHGRVSFTRGDIRNGVWMGSVRTQLADASGHAPGGGGEAHAAHYGGGWSRRGQDGSWTEWWPDGTTFAVGASGAVPTRHSVDASQARVRRPFSVGERVPSPPTAFPINLVHPSGATLTLAANGAWTIHAAGGAQVVIDQSGGVTVTASTAVNITAPSIVAGNGGVTKFVKLADNTNSTILRAQ